MNFDQFNESAVMRSEHSANQHLQKSDAEKRREAANAASRQAIAKHKAAQAKKGPMHKLKKMFSFEEYIAESVAHHEEMAAELHKEAQHSKPGTPSHTAAMAAHHWHASQAEHKKGNHAMARAHAKSSADYASN